MVNCEALIIGGSAGSLDVLLKVLPAIDSQIKFPIIIVIHRKNGTESLLPELLSGHTRLTVKEAEEKEALLPGTIYIAPSDYHLLLELNHTFSLDYSEKINFSRPAIDPTFQTGAEVFKDKLVCLLLSGSNADGVNGLKTAKNWGGRVIIQNPETAQVAFMPEQAKLQVDTDFILNAEDMAEFINLLSKPESNGFS
ncbi:two-component system chemotaxis response regulator CheB [Pedobacter sp. CG_S7]|uniref:chemotaxis protein CheB n=1 Tax=Pedobacter sp. CG_S7 TaxID=3143930 RepID=UPI003392C2E4